MTPDHVFTLDFRVTMFSSLSPITHGVTLYLDGQPLAANTGESVAACLLRAGVAYNRLTPVSGTPRLPYCMIGHCFDCLVEIDGVGNQQACLTIVHDGMQVRRQNGAASAVEDPTP